MDDSNPKNNFDNEKSKFILVGLCAVVSAILLAWIGHVYIVGKYENDSHNTNSYVDSDYYRTFQLDLVKSCGVHIKPKTKKQQESCKQTKEFIDSLATISDLRAQQTMAHATRGILVGGWFQYLTSVLALALIGVTFYATWRMLEQAASTADYARATLIAANAATTATNKTADAAVNAERAHIHITYKAKFSDKTSCSRANATNWAKHGSFEVQPVIHNFGKTPAFNVRYAINKRGAIGAIRSASGLKAEFERATMVDIGVMSGDSDPIVLDLISEDSTLDYVGHGTPDFIISAIWSFDDVFGTPRAFASETRIRFVDDEKKDTTDWVYDLTSGAVALGMEASVDKSSDESLLWNIKNIAIKTVFIKIENQSQKEAGN